MSNRSYRVPGTRQDLPLGVLTGAGFALLLFVMMALTQMMSAVKPPPREIDETLIGFNPPTIEEVKEEPPPPPKEEEPPPELEEQPPELSLDQLDIALNPGTGGSLAGDFSLPTISTSQQALGTEDFVDFSDLDQIPRPIGVSGFDFPLRLKKKAVRGTLVLLVKLNPEGDVTDVSLESSDLPQFDSFVLGEVKRWRFTPPTQQGRPVNAKARLPIPIHIKD